MRIARIERIERNELGASLVEYALLLVLIAMVCLAAVQFFGSSVGRNFSQTGSSIERAG
jgi:Flp pilus assembly pilin Flp